MASVFLDALIDRRTSLRAGDKRLLYAAVGLIGFALVATLSMNGLMDFWRAVLYHNIPDDRLDALRANIPYITSDLWRVVLFMCAALAGLWMFLSRKIGVAALGVLIALIAFVDGSIVDSRFIKIIDPATFPGIAPDKAVRELQRKMENNAPFRVFAGLLTLSQIQSPNYYAMFGIQSADGHHNNELQTYELFTGKIFNNYFRSWLEDYSFKPEGIVKNNFLRVAGVRYIAVPLSKNGTELVENTAALPRAYVVHDCVVVPNDTLAVEKLKDPAFDPAKTAIVHEECTIGLPGADAEASSSQVTDFTYTRDGMRMKAECAAPGLLVLSENYVPYWSASVDGKPAPIFRAYGTFMAVACPAGSHEVVFTYRSSPYETGKKLTLVSLAFVVVVMAVTGILQMTKRVKKDG